MKDVFKLISTAGNIDKLQILKFNKETLLD